MVFLYYKMSDIKSMLSDNIVSFLPIWTEICSSLLSQLQRISVILIYLLEELWKIMHIKTLIERKESASRGRYSDGLNE